MPSPHYGTRYTLIPVLLAQVLLAGQAPENLLGRWRSLETSKGGIGAMLNFHVDGVVDFSPGAVVEMPYRIEGDQLILPPATTNGPEQKQQLEFRGETHLRLIIRQGDQRAFTDLTRKGAAGEAGKPIVGEWVGSRQMQGKQLEVHYFFYAGGKCLFLLPFSTKSGHYSIEGSNMLLDFPNTPPAEGKFHFEGDVLTVPSQSGNGSRYARY